ncbi:MAG: hypothetical protein ACFE9C_01345 [Candidatus Hodarchaeota archaeon]
MAKKNKYKLFSYLIENNLIYYKSLKENSKIISFAILESQNYKIIDPFLNDLLKRRIINYYSIQIDTTDKNKKIILLNFEEYKKENVMKSFNVVQQNLEEIKISTKFLHEKTLEERFLTIIFQNLKPNTTITKTSESIIITEKNKSKIFSFYTIDFNYIEKKTTFISSFLNLITNIGEKGSMILNFKTGNSEEIMISPYFVLKSENFDKIHNFDNNVNSFFHSNLLRKYNVKIKTFVNLLWRLGINNNFFFLSDYDNLFDSENLTISLDVIAMNKILEEKLLNYQIEYIRLSKNLIFIEQKYVFLILEHLDYDYIYKIIEKYQSKYFIYILILNDLGNKELQKIKSIKLIKSIKILNPIEIRDFNYKKFKTTVH